MSARKRVPIPVRVEPGADLPESERSAVLEAVRQNRALQGASPVHFPARDVLDKDGFHPAGVPFGDFSQEAAPL